eukprot:scaffold118254_cov30-Phaeocystis_antarctica.AAC.1
MSPRRMRSGTRAHDPMQSCRRRSRRRRAPRLPWRSEPRGRPLLDRGGLRPMASRRSELARAR